MPFNILWPTIALVLLIFIVLTVMYHQRFAHMRKNPPREQDFANGESAMRYFAPVEMPANNFRNLFEMPVLYFALVPLLLITHHANHIQVILAWVYVVLRAIHSFIHIGPKTVKHRFLVYLVSCAVLAAMWIGFTVDMATAAGAYDAAMANISG
jgi:hypothetical protein